MAGWNITDRVTIAVFEGEPLARLAAQRLQEEGIPCLAQPLGVGPGGWGLAANLSYALYVLPVDEARARDVLEVLPPPAEGSNGWPEGQQRRWSAGILVLLLVIAAAVLLNLADRLFGALLR